MPISQAFVDCLSLHKGESEYEVNRSIARFLKN